MKKTKVPVKKTNKNTMKSSKASPVLAKAKTVATGWAKSLTQSVAGKVKAMSPKSSKKVPQTKPAPVSKAAHHPKPGASKKTPPIKIHLQQKAAAAKVAPGKKEPSKEVHAKPVAKGVSVPAAKAPVGKPAPALTKGKSLTAAKGTKTAKSAASGYDADKMCRENACENLATTKGYCRLDYIKNWKKIKRKEMILKEGKLNQYIEELVSKYPDKYIDVIRQDLCTEVNFTKVIHDLELDESIDDLDYDGDSIDSLIGSIKKENDDFGGDDEF